jgi:hypothetical protein
MIKQAKNGYHVQMSKTHKEYWTVSRNKEGEPAIMLDTYEKAYAKFNELVNEE